MKIQKVNLGQNFYIWLVLDDNFLPVNPIVSFIKYLNNTEKSPNTVYIAFYFMIDLSNIILLTNYLVDIN